MDRTRKPLIKCYGQQLPRYSQPATHSELSQNSLLPNKQKSSAAYESSSINHHPSDLAVHYHLSTINFAFCFPAGTERLRPIRRIRNDRSVRLPAREHCV